MEKNYENHIAKLEEEIKVLQKKNDFFSFSRLAGFILFFIGLIFSISSGNLLWVAATVIFLIIFIQLILRDVKNSERLQTAQISRDIAKNEISCLKLQPNVYYNGSDFIHPDHDYSNDMDVFGESSLFAYINRCATGVGNRTLAAFLASTQPPSVSTSRQTAVKELAKKTEWMQLLRIQLYKSRITNYNSQNLPSIENTSQPSAAIRSGIIVSYSLLLACLLAVIFLGVSAVFLTLPIAFNILFANKASRFTKTVKMQLEGREKTLNDYHNILQAFESQSWQSSYLKNLQEKLSHKSTNATQAIARLRALSLKLDYSLNMIAGAILNFVFIWDILICVKISGWFNDYAHKTKDWFDVAGETEALMSLAILQNNHPHWTYPHFDIASGFLFEASHLGHPLIDSKERVCNDFSINHNQYVSIITGSNMAGKSTFLRSVGVNIILAHAGAVCCAEKLNLSHFRIMTYLTITDSLSEHTSTFYREIKRLKKILDSARANSNVLLLLDELLRGTNSADKAKGSMAITRDLILNKIPALIATHNLELANMQQQHPEVLQNYFFDITIDNNSRMHFDYKLKPGICNTFNASLLLKEIGIDIDS